MSKSKWGVIPISIISLFILSALFFFNKTPVSYEEYILVNIACLLWLPALYILLIESNEISVYGFCPATGKLNGYKLAGLLYACVLPFLIIASQMDSFRQYYPIQKQAVNDWMYFGYFELTYGMYLFCWEYFFRGFMLFGLNKYIGWSSVIAQSIAFGIMHIGKPFPEVIASFGAGIILGIVALRAKSFLPCFILHWASALTFDLLIILSKRGILF